MSITTELRSYADKAQAQLNDVTGQANELYGKTKENVSEITNKATSVVHDLRVSAEKAVNLDALKTAVEPYLAQAKDYTAQVTDRAESLLNGVKSDKRVAKLVETVEERVVKPVQSLLGRSAKPAPKRPAAAKPATTAAAAKPATKPAATKPASKPAARKAPAKRTTRS
jgi:uncharacterized phage infection (PIP) family protein YhgE